MTSSFQLHYGNDSQTTEIIDFIQTQVNTALPQSVLSSSVLCVDKLKKSILG